MADPKDAQISALLARLEALESKLAQQPQVPGARLTRLHVVVLTDITIETGRKVLSKLDETVKPARVVEYENVFGLALNKGQELDVDVLESQMSAFQAAVDAGHIVVQGMAKSKGARA